MTAESVIESNLGGAWEAITDNFLEVEASRANANGSGANLEENEWEVMSGTFSVWSVNSQPTNKEALCLDPQSAGRGHCLEPNPDSEKILKLQSEEARCQSPDGPSTKNAEPSGERAARSKPRRKIKGNQDRKAKAMGRDHVPKNKSLPPGIHDGEGHNRNRTKRHRLRNKCRGPFPNPGYLSDEDILYDVEGIDQYLSAKKEIKQKL